MLRQFFFELLIKYLESRADSSAVKFEMLLSGLVAISVKTGTPLLAASCICWRCSAVIWSPMPVIITMS